MEHFNSLIKLENIAKDYYIFVHTVIITHIQNTDNKKHKQTKPNKPQTNNSPPLAFGNIVTVSSPSEESSKAPHTNTGRTGLLKKSN